MFGALKRGRFRSLAIVFLILVVNVVGELQRKRTLAASRGFLAAARLSCNTYSRIYFTSGNESVFAICVGMSVCLSVCHTLHIPLIQSEV